VNRIDRAAAHVERAQRERAAVGEAAS
jgi:hypothetical protein